MSLHELPLNDMMAQVARKLIKKSPLEEEERINEIRSCNHLFVKLRDFDTSTYDGIDLSVVECVHCGVTNKYKELERVMRKYRRSLEIYVRSRLHTTNAEYNDQTIESMLMDEIKEHNGKLNLMSDEVIRTFHPGLLYRLANIINPTADDKELFGIMKELNNLETTEERNKLNNENDAIELIDRYSEKVKVLKK